MFAPLSKKSVDYIYLSLFLCSLFLRPIYYTALTSVASQYILNVDIVSSTPVALFQNCFGYSSSFNFPYVIFKNQSHSSHLLYGFLVLQKISIFTVVLYLVKTSSNIFSKYIMQMFITFDPIYPVPETYVKNAQI